MTASGHPVPVLLVGFGGVLAEAIHDVRILPPDLSCCQIEEELYKLHCGALLRGFRGSPALDVGAVARIISALSWLIRSPPGIEAIDINPLVVLPAGARRTCARCVDCGRGEVKRHVIKGTVQI